VFTAETAAALRQAHAASAYARKTQLGAGLGASSARVCRPSVNHQGQRTGLLCVRGESLPTPTGTPALRFSGLT
jgi:hypothetical protein